MEILAISGSLRAASYNTMALNVARALAPEGVNVTVTDLGGIPPTAKRTTNKGSPRQSRRCAVLFATAMPF